jgi:uncharacterized membrane protein required for colicin V production
MNWVDAVIIVILIASTVKGYSQGFVLSLMNIAGFIAAIAAARLYFGSLARYIMEETVIYQKIYLAVVKGLEGANPVFGGGDRGGQEMPGFLESLILPGGTVPVGGNPALSGIAQTISSVIVSILSIILIFVAVRLVFAAVVSMLNSLVKLPVLRQFNRLGGIVTGFLKGALGLMLAFALLIPLMAVFSVEWLVRGIEGSAYAIYFYRYNLIIPWAMEFVSRITGGV